MSFAFLVAISGIHYMRILSSWCFSARSHLPPYSCCNIKAIRSIYWLQFLGIHDIRRVHSPAPSSSSALQILSHEGSLPLSPPFTLARLSGKARDSPQNRKGIDLERGERASQSVASALRESLQQQLLHKYNIQPPNPRTKNARFPVYWEKKSIIIV